MKINFNLSLMKINLSLIVAIVMVFGLDACKSKNPGTPDTNIESVAHPESKLTDKHWKLVEIMGEPVTYPEGYADQAFIVFNSDGKVHGNLGCNTFSGTYTLQEGNRIHFSQVLSTLKMCINVEIEDRMRELLEIADNYSLNGDKLVLNRARMAPLALFEKVEEAKK
jgi:heat shock protein HslJ